MKRGAKAGKAVRSSAEALPTVFTRGFVVAGLLGMLLWPIALPLAYLGHAAWDFAHHNRSRLALVAIPQWYVPWCVMIDVIVGFGLIALWTAHGVI